MADTTALEIGVDRHLCDFLKAVGLADAELQVLASGLSAKRFYRVAGRNLVVLDARSVAGLTARYEAVAQTIAENGGIAPKVYQSDHAAGFALVEFLGDLPLSQLIDQSLDKRSWFQIATEARALLHGAQPPLNVSIPQLTDERIAAEVQPFGRIAATGLADLQSRADFLDEYEDVWAGLSRTFPRRADLVLADFEPENLMLVEGNEQSRIGILDFDEAFVGDQAYDLASLVESARRTTDPAIVSECIGIYARMTGEDVDELTERVGLWSLQRHLRILGIFLDQSRPSHGRFAHYIPNLLVCVRQNLRFDVFRSLRRLLEESGIPGLDQAA